MAVRIIIDSASDFTEQEAKEANLLFLPMTVAFGEKEYRDTVDMSHREFYERLIESDDLPKTSQITPVRYKEVYQKVAKAGDSAVVIALSSKLSGTCQAAMIAAEEYEETIFVVDSENASVGERVLVMRAIELCKKGLSAKEIAGILDTEKKRIRLLAILDTLEYLQKGGRISTAVAFAGKVLSIKPVISIVDGEVAMIGKARGSKNGNNLLRELIAKGNGVDYEMPYCLGYTGLSNLVLQKYIEDSADLWKNHADTLPTATVGCTIGTHVGPGAVAVAFFEKEPLC